MSDEKPKRGGARPGAGRKKKPPGQKKITVAVALLPDLVEWLDAQPGKSRSAKVEAFLRERMDK